MTVADLMVRGGTVVTSAGRTEADLAISDGRFVAIAAHGELKIEAHEVFDATGRFVLPGVIDGHVHLREPGLEHKEDWLTGSRAAIMGGVTTVIDMPNTIPPTASVDDARAKRALAEARALCDFGLIGLLAADHLDQLAPMARQGLVVGFKAFLGPTTGDIEPPDDDALLEGMRTIAGLGMRLGLHAEDGALIDRLTARLRRAGRDDTQAHLEARPIEAEVVAIERAARIASVARCPLHVFHLSSRAGLDAIERWRADGVDITCEASPHHCFLTAEDAVRLGPSSRVNPPLRVAGHRDALLSGLAEGRVEAIATDHAPHTRAEKSGDTIWQVAPGFPGVETSLRLFLTHGVAAGRLTLEQIARATSEGPARTWGLWPRKGAIAVGSDADLTIVDLEAEGVIRGADLHGMTDVTPFEGHRTRGTAVATIVRGRIVMREGELMSPPGWGRNVAAPAT